MNRMNSETNLTAFGKKAYIQFHLVAADEEQRLRSAAKSVVNHATRCTRRIPWDEPKVVTQPIAASQRANNYCFNPRQIF